MTAVNGVTTPPDSSDAGDAVVSGTKRKRLESSTAMQANGIETPEDKIEPANSDNGRLHELLADLHIVMEKYDTKPSILEQPLGQDRSGSASDEPSSKRMKLSDADSIGKRLQQRAYVSLDALKDDIELVTSKMLEVPTAKDDANSSGGLGASTQPLQVDARLTADILAFRKICNSTIEHEKARDAEKKSATELASGAIKSEKATTNGVKNEPEQELDILSNGRKVLTVFAAAPQPRQLFSSFQQPVQVQDPLAGLIDPALFEVTLPLREEGLPNIISTTIVPQLPPPGSLGSKKPVPTFGEKFAPPRTLPPLEPPQPSKQTTTKSNVIGFVSDDDLVRSTRRDSYNWCGSALTVGQWLGYGGVDAVQEPTSPEAKRKQRDRALSTGEARPPPSTAELHALERAKEEALFRQVYSSFAPSQDDGGAVVPVAVKNMVWWQKVGRKRAQRLRLIEPDLPTFGQPVKSAWTNEVADEEEEAFKQTVEQFDPSILEPEHLERSQGEKDTDAVLAEVTDLIETLYSLQLNRNMSVSKPQTRDAQDITRKSIGTPSTPSEEEIIVYKTLQAQLAALVANLPPYLVARLDGDRLKELNVSANILIETSDDPGVMEEDSVSRHAKQPAAPVAVGPQTGARPSSSTSFANYQQSAGQYTRTPGAQAPPARTTAGTYFPQQQANRAALPYQRTSSGAQGHGGSYPAGTPRQSYQQTPQQYVQSAPRSGYGPAGGSHLQQLQSAAGGVRAGTSQFYASTPQNATPSRGYSAQTPVPLYQRPANTAPMYNHPPQSPHQRTASPLTASGSVGPTTYSNHGRQPYAPPGGQARSQYIPPGSQGLGMFTPNLPPGNVGDQQGALRAQLAAQAQARLAAATNANQVVGSPTRTSSGPAQPHYGQNPKMNGTPGPKKF